MKTEMKIKKILQNQPQQKQFVRLSSTFFVLKLQDRQHRSLKKKTKKLLNTPYMLLSKFVHASTNQSINQSINQIIGL